MSIYERYDIKDEDDLIEAAEKLSAFLDAQTNDAKVVKLRGSRARKA